MKLTPKDWLSVVFFNVTPAEFRTCNYTNIYKYLAKLLENHITKYITSSFQLIKVHLLFVAVEGSNIQ